MLCDRRLSVATVMVLLPLVSEFIVLKFIVLKFRPDGLRPTKGHRRRTQKQT